MLSNETECLLPVNFIAVLMNQHLSIVIYNFIKVLQKAMLRKCQLFSRAFEYIINRVHYAPLIIQSLSLI